MKSRWKLLTALALLTAGIGVEVTSALPAAATCAPRMFVVAGYQNGGLGPLATNPPPGYEVVNVRYPNGMWDLNFDYDVNAGVNALNFAVNDYYDHCGNPQALIVGYSLGALVAGNVLQTQPAYRNIQGLLFSDARRLPAYPGDPGGAEGPYPWAIPGNGLRGFQNPTVTLCNAPDLVCFGGPDLPSYFTAHPDYTFNPALELQIHGWGNYKNIVY